MKKALFAFASLFLVQSTFASLAIAVGSGGFEIATNSARSIGKSNAVVADPEDPSTIAFNPAGLTKLEGNQVTTGTGVIWATYEYESPTGNGEDASQAAAAVPSAFASFSTPNENLVVGGGINSPFGLSTKYSSTGAFKYSSYFNELITMSYNLSAAYQISPRLSFGGGVNYIQSDLKQVGKLNSNFITSTVIPGTTGLADAPFELDVDGDGVGYNLGLLFDLADNQTLGVYYKSEVAMKLTGEMNVDSITGLVLPTLFGGSTFNTTADTDLTLPASINFGYNLQINDKWGWEIDLAWTDWSSFDRVDIAFGRSNAVLDSLEPVTEFFEDSISVYTAASYKFNDTWNGNFGAFFMEMAASEANYSNAIPDGDRYAVTAGLEYNKSNYSIDLSYLLEFVDEVGIDNAIGAGNGTTVDGEYAGVVHIFIVGATYRY